MHMEKKEVNYKQLCFLLLCFFTYLLWMVVIPYNKCPDEYMRMDLVNFMLKHGTLPTDTILLSEIKYGVFHTPLCRLSRR
jgi:hypothetical protein